jgi:hypothetical protein
MEREGEERSSRLSHQPTTSVSRNDVVNDLLLYIYSEKKQKITICNNLRNLVSSFVLPGIDRAGLTNQEPSIYRSLLAIFVYHH